MVEAMTESTRSDTFPPHESVNTEPIAGALQKAWWLALGLAATVGEQTTRAAEALVEKGRHVEPHVSDPLRRAASGMSGVAEGARSRVKRAAAGLGSVGVPAGFRGRPPAPTMKEFERLSAEVRELRSRLDRETRQQD